MQDTQAYGRYEEANVVDAGLKAGESYDYTCADRFAGGTADESDLGERQGRPLW
jgi:hypothetical protein